MAGSPRAALPIATERTAPSSAECAPFIGQPRQSPGGSDDRAVVMVAGSSETLSDARSGSPINVPIEGDKGALDGHVSPATYATPSPAVLSPGAG